MELYVHIPFCRQKCRYCDFASYAGCENRMGSYVEAVLQEAAVQSARLHHPQVETVFLGGGTPSLLPADLLTRLLQGLREHFTVAAEAEFTSEANPGTLTPAWLDAAISGGVNRLSMGMQAKQDTLLRTLDRIHDYAQVEQSVELARQAGITNLSLDLMFGLPGQTLADWQETLQAALALHPQHLSCYGLIPEDGTPLKADLDAGRLTLPDEETERIMYDDALSLLSCHGFQQYEISNFALPGYACRHNLGYWRQIPYLGLGASASSMLTDSPTTVYTRETNPAQLADYLRMTKTADWSKREVIPISAGEARFETMMLGLRTTEGVSCKAFQKMHGISVTDCYGPQLENLRNRGLVSFIDGCWWLTRRGMDVQNAILVDLMDD